MLLFLLVFLPGCLYDEPNVVSELRSERQFSREESTDWESASEPDARETIRRDYDQQVAEGTDVVAEHIQYLEEVDKGNERFLRKESEKSISEDRKIQLQEAAKSRHFEQLKKLLKL